MSIAGSLLEPQSRDGSGDRLDRNHALASIAISLKRIADALESVTDHAFNEPAIRTRS